MWDSSDTSLMFSEHCPWAHLILEGNWDGYVMTGRHEISLSNLWVIWDVQDNSIIILQRYKSFDTPSVCRTPNQSHWLRCPSWWSWDNPRHGGLLTVHRNTPRKGLRTFDDDWRSIKLFESSPCQNQVPTAVWFWSSHNTVWDGDIISKLNAYTETSSQGPF